METIKIGDKTFQYDVLEDNQLKVITGYETKQVANLDGTHSDIEVPVYEVLLTLHYYKFTYNENNFITGFGAVLDDNYDWYGQASCFDIPLGYGCYKFEGGEPVLDQEEYERLEEIHAKESRIAELKAKLQETDYIYNSIREGGRSEEYYAEVIENRKAWRREIQELEEELGI